MKITIKMRLLITFITTLILLITINIISLVLNETNTSYFNIIEETIIPQNLAIARLQYNIVQIQQFLTDISATRGKEGFDQGFDEAKMYYNQAREVLKELISVSDQIDSVTGATDHDSSYLDQGDINDIRTSVEGHDTGIHSKENHLDEVTIAELLLEVQDDIEGFYLYGIQMAETYIDRGTDEGNAYMEEFDELSMHISHILDDLLILHHAWLDYDLDLLSDNFNITRWLPIFLSLAALLIIAALTFLAFKAIITPVTNMIKGTEKMAQGDLTALIQITSQDELGTMAEGFNDNMEQLKEIIGGIKESSNETISAQDKLASSSELAVSTVSHISGSVTAIEEKTDTLDSDIAASAAATEEIARNIEGLNNQIENQAAMVEEATASITEMITSINNVSNITTKKKESTGNLVNTSNDGKAKLVDTTDAITKITGSMDSIKQMTNLINQIAAQTNMLAMNAAIEAAHAGSAGRGFAVVADEIRKLAETSRKNSKGINTVIKEVILQIETASESGAITNQAFEKVEGEVRQVVEAFEEIEQTTSELQIGGKQILDAITELQNVSMQIKSGIIEIKSGSEEVAHSMTNVKHISRDVITSVGDISKDTHTISDVINTLKGINNKISETTEKLSGKINRFTID